MFSGTLFQAISYYLQTKSFLQRKGACMALQSIIFTPNLICRPTPGLPFRGSPRDGSPSGVTFVQLNSIPTMSKEELTAKKAPELVAICEGELNLGDRILPCAVLSDNTRVITASSVFEAFDRPRKGKSSEEYRADRMPSFINANNLQPFVKEELMEWTKPIEYRNKFGSIKTGYNAHILRGLCMVYIEGRKNGALLKSQERFADIATSILFALSGVGIVALVDEATGYQYSREKDELQRILKAYISEELLPWQKKFPDIFYKELFRLNGWELSLKGIKQRPGVIGKWTNELIYKQLPEGVLEELKRKTPVSESGNRTARYHQSLTTDVGEPNLAMQINQVITVFQLSNNMKQMWQLFEKLKLRQKGQLEIPFVFDDNDHTVDPEVE